MLIPVTNKQFIEEQILSCPFCGKRPKVWRVESINLRVRYFIADGGSATCPAKAVRTKYYETLEEAIRAWNTRS